MPEKYEREIEEILRKASFSSPKGRRHSDGWMTRLASEWQQFWSGVSPTRLLALGLVLALVGYFLREFVPEIGAPISLLALGLLLAGLILSMSRRSGRRPQGWRGRSFDEPTSNVDLWAVLKRRWENWRRRRGWNDSQWP